MWFTTLGEILVDPPASPGQVIAYQRFQCTDQRFESMAGRF
jgi:hypothetical protein